MTTIRLLRAAVITVFFAGALGGCAAYEKCGFRGCPGDQKITTAVLDLYSQHSDLQEPTKITVKTIDGVVYLYGQVNTDVQRQEAESLALQVDGVKNVINSISLTYP